MVLPVTVRINFRMNKMPAHSGNTKTVYAII
jgi:hypothetical protein